MKTLQQLKAQILANPEARKEYDALGEEFGMARELIAARASAETPKKLNCVQLLEQTPCTPLPFAP